MTLSLRRVRALARKETYQVIRDPSSIAIGVLLPLILIVIVGYGLSLDLKDVKVAVVIEEPSPEASELAAGFRLSRSFDARILTSMVYAQDLMLARSIDAIVRIPQDFARRLGLGNAEVQVILHGTDANRARGIDRYAKGAIAQFVRRQTAEGKRASRGIVVVSRLWFNEANDSHYFLVPGLIVLVMTLVGAMLTALVVAREWERGTLEAIFVTPVEPAEIILGKMVPYLVLGAIGLALCLGSARLLFGVPFRGSIALLCGVSFLYLLVALGLGLVVSSVLRNQFLASQITLVLNFMPAALLSGLMFDFHDMPAGARLLTYALPARYFMALLKTLFLSGNVTGIILPNAAVLAFFAALLLGLTRASIRKSLE